MREIIQKITDSADSHLLKIKLLLSDQNLNEDSPNSRSEIGNISKVLAKDTFGGVWSDQVDVKFAQLDLGDEVVESFKDPEQNLVVMFGINPYGLSEGEVL